jgi:hypothetical protein
LNPLKKSGKVQTMFTNLTADGDPSQSRRSAVSRPRSEITDLSGLAVANPLKNQRLCRLRRLFTLSSLHLRAFA